MSSPDIQPGKPHAPSAPDLSGFAKKPKRGARLGTLTAAAHVSQVVDRRNLEQPNQPAQAPTPVPSSENASTQPEAEVEDPQLSRREEAELVELPPEPPPPVAEARSAHRPEKGDETPSASVSPLPKLEVDISDPAALAFSPTMVSVPASIGRRFEKARQQAPSHTAVVLEALRAHAEQLPALVIKRMPSGTPGDLFPWRDMPGKKPERPVPLRIRPTVGELQVLDGLVTWVTGELRAKGRLAAGKSLSRSEVVVAALDAYLPHIGRRK